MTQYQHTHVLIYFWEGGMPWWGPARAIKYAIPLPEIQAQECQAR